MGTNSRLPLRFVTAIFVTAILSMGAKNTMENLEQRTDLQEPQRWFIALMLPPGLETQAQNVIADLSDRYQTRAAYAPPHITVRSPFPYSPQSISEIEAILADFATSQAPVPIQLKNFSAFPPRVLFINVLHTAELLALQNQLNHRLVSQGQLPQEKHRQFKPHVTVASRKLTRAKFERIWAELQEQEFVGEFVCDRLTLLGYEQQRWHCQREFALSGIKR